MRFLIVATSLVLFGCDKSSVVLKSETYQFTKYDGEFPESFSVEEIDEMDGVEKMRFGDVDLAVVTDITPRSYGNGFSVRVYNKFEWGKAIEEEANLLPWQECLRFNAKSYESLRIALDEKKDQLLVYGKKPGSQDEELVMQRFNFTNGLQGFARATSR